MSLSNYLQEMAKTELNEDVGKIQQCVQEIRDWLQKQPHLIVNAEEDQWILTFLRCCKYNLEETKRRIDFYFTTKIITPEFLDNKDPLLPEIQEILNRGVCVPIKVEKGPAKILIIWRNVNPDNVTFKDVFKYGLMLYDILLEEDDFVISGQEILHDMRAFPIDLVKQMSPVICKKAMFTILDAYPSRIKRIAFFYSPPTYELFTKAFEPFLSQDVKNIVTIHKGGLEEVYKELPLTEFPKEYGGESGSLDELIGKWKLKFESYRTRFLESAKYLTDELKREGGPKTSSDVYNICESFGKLDID